MKPKEIQELLDFIANSGLAEVNIETDQFKIAVKKHSTEAPRAQQSVAQPVIIASSVPAANPPANSAASQVPQIQEKAEKTAEASKDKNYITIKSPMIGTFYRSSNPETPSFVNIGDEIAPGKPVCIIEAMKLFNEIESEISGTIIKVLVENATPVEYDQPLFLVEPK